MYKGFYINLEKSKDRNTLIQKNLKQLKIEKKYERVEGINGKEIYQNYETKLNPGSLGCWLSHEKILEENIGSDKHIHILEDDALLSPAVPKMFNNLNLNIEWDIIFTDVYFSLLSPNNFFKLFEKYKLFKEKNQISLMSLYGIPFNAATSYLVNKNSIEKLNKLLGKNYSGSIKHDTAINNLVQQKKLKAYVTVPFISTITSLNSNSTINETEHNTNLIAMDLIRKSFYIESNINNLHAEVENLKRKEETNKIIDIYTTSTSIILNNIHNKKFKK